MCILSKAQSGDTSIMIDHSLQHHTRLTNANRGMDEMLDSGSNVLASLKEQRMSLKVTRKFVTYIYILRLLFTITMFISVVAHRWYVKL